MALGRTFWIEVAVLLVVETLAWFALSATGHAGAGGTPIQLGPLAAGAALILSILLALGLGAIALHGWIRGDGGTTSHASTPAAAPVTDLLRIVSETPPGAVHEGEALEKHLDLLVHATMATVGADAAVIEIIDENVVSKAYAAGGFSPYKGLRGNVQGTVVETALRGSKPIEWHEPPNTPATARSEFRSMFVAPIRAGARSFGVVRVAYRRSRPASSEPGLLDVLGKYVGAVLWNAPAKAFEAHEAEKEAGDRKGAREARARFDSFLDSLEHAVWISDPKGGQVVVVNRAFERVWGRSTDLLYRSPKAWLEALAAPQRAAVEKMVLKSDGDPFDLTYTLKRPDGNEVVIAHRRFALRDDKGGLVGVANVAMDVSDRQQATTELANLKRHVAPLIEDSPVVAYGARPGGDYGLTFVTPNVDAVLGFAGSSFTSDPTFWSAHLHPDDQPRVFEGLARLFEKGRIEQDYRFRHSDGTYRNIRDTSRLVRSDDGEPVEIVGFWTDVTERKRAEEGMAYSLNRIKELQESRTRLLNNIAHDLGSPLTPIGLQLHLLKARTDLAEPAKKGLDIIQRNVDHVALLINDLRDVARLEAGQLKVDLEPIDLSDLLTKAVESFQQPAQERKITLRSKIAKNLPVTADAQRLNQVVFNFLTNALKFTPEGGTVDVNAGKDGPMVIVKVKDSGRGLTKDEMDRLFKPFSQVHDRAQVKEKGTGLGLYISKNLIEKHNGKIWVDSEGHGHGSTFAFSVPYRGK